MTVGSCWRCVLTNEQVFCVLVDTLISKFTWRALIGLSVLPHIKDDMKLGGVTSERKQMVFNKGNSRMLRLYFSVRRHESLSGS